MGRPKYSDDRKERRHHRVVELLRHELVDIIQREVKDPRLGKFTVTSVELSPDLRLAKVAVCKFVTGSDLREPSREEQETLIEGLASAQHFIYERLKRRLVMKQIPSLKFEYDSKLNEVTAIWNLVRKTSDDDQTRGLAYGV